MKIKITKRLYQLSTNLLFHVIPAKAGISFDSVRFPVLPVWTSQAGKLRMTNRLIKETFTHKTQLVGP